jgi:protein-ribulosamine 3-kinase
LRADPVAGALATAISDATEASFEPLSLAPVSGGCIHTAYRLDGEDAAGKRSYFAKVNEPESAAMFAAEAEGLAALRAAGAVRVPEIVARGEDDERAWLVLEWLDLVPLDVASAAKLGDDLAALHRMPQQRFGWGRNNYIGASPQPNAWSEDWLDFWRRNRLHPQLRYAAHNRLPSRMIDRGERLLADSEILLREHKPAPSLLHGDLWGGNASALADGTPALFDPAVYVGDREADVAMTELFGGFPKDFAAAYRNAWPLTDGYSVRRDFYNIYHVLNHANLFAGDYVRQAERAIEKVLAEL